MLFNFVSFRSLQIFYNQNNNSNIEEQIFIAKYLDTKQESMSDSRRNRSSQFSIKGNSQDQNNRNVIPNAHSYPSSYNTGRKRPADDSIIPQRAKHTQEKNELQ